MGRASRDKGARGELELVKLLPGAEKVSAMHTAGPDLIWLDRPVEVKRHAKPALPKRFQSYIDEGNILIDRADHGHWTAHIDLTQLLDILAERWPFDFLDD